MTNPGVAAGHGKKAMLSERVWERVRSQILNGTLAPGQPLRPQSLADEHGVSLAVVREALLQLVGEGMAHRLPNRGFAVPSFGDQRWQQIMDARLLIEPEILRLSVNLGDLDWEANVQAAHHRLIRTPLVDHDHCISETWISVHRAFHRALLQACDNEILLETAERLWNAFELARRWSDLLIPDRNHIEEHTAIAQAAVARDVDTAVEMLRTHLTITASGLAAVRETEETAMRQGCC